MLHQKLLFLSSIWLHKLGEVECAASHLKMFEETTAIMATIFCYFTSLFFTIFFGHIFVLFIFIYYDFILNYLCGFIDPSL